VLFRKILAEASTPLISTLSNPAEWLVRIIGGNTTFSGEHVTPETAILNSNVFTCASILGGDIGKLPIQVFRRTRDNGIQRDLKHPTAEILGVRANPYMSAYTFKELMKVHQVLWGNGYANIEWSAAGYPKALWPLNPAQTDVEVDDNGNVWYITTLPNGEMRKLPPEDVVHFKGLSLSGLKGITPIAVIREKIGIQQASDKFIGSFYANGTTTRGILKVPAPLEEPAKAVVRREWEKLHTGLTNAHRIAILDAGIEYQNIGMPLEDAQFIETQKWGISEIAKIYKIPPHKLGQLDRATFSNIEHQSLEYVKNTLQPDIVNWEQELDYKMFTRTERMRYYVKFNLTSELRGDSKSRAEYYSIMIGTGVYSINEVRALEEQSSIGEIGDKHYMSLNYTTLENLEEYQRAKASLNNNKKGGEDENEGNDE